MHVFPLSIQNVVQRVVFNFLCVLPSKLEMSFHILLYILLCFLLNLLHLPSFFSPSRPCMQLCEDFSLTFVNCLICNNHGTSSLLGILQIFCEVFCYLSLVSSCCIFQLVTLIIIVSLIKYFHVQTSLFTLKLNVFSNKYRPIYQCHMQSIWQAAAVLHADMKVQTVQD